MDGLCHPTVAMVLICTVHRSASRRWISVECAQVSAGGQSSLCCGQTDRRRVCVLACVRVLCVCCAGPGGDDSLLHVLHVLRVSVWTFASPNHCVVTITEARLKSKLSAAASTTCSPALRQPCTRKPQRVRGGPTQARSCCTVFEILCSILRRQLLHQMPCSFPMSSRSPSTTSHPLRAPTFAGSGSLQI